MRNFLRDAGHLVRPAVVLVIGLGIFMMIRGLVIPKAFGQYGHYRPGALGQIRQKPVVFAGQAQCLPCHDTEATARQAGKHAHVACEACHGPLAAHVADPTSIKPARPEVAKLCVRCHEKDAAKPKAFPQVISAEHSGGVVCNTCHQPHNPHL